MSNRVLTRRVLSLLELFAVLCVVAVFVVPIFWIIITAFKPAADVYSLKVIFTPTLNNFRSLFGSGVNFFPFMINSIVVTAATLSIAIPISTLAAYAFSRYRFPGKNLLMFWILSLKFIPAVILILPFFVLYRDLGLLDTRIGLIIVNVGIVTPVSIWLMKGFIDGIPIAIEEAALIDGCSRLGVIWKMIVPMAKPGILTTAVFCFVFTWNEFMFPLILTRQNAVTLPVGLMLLKGERGVIWEQMAAAGLILVIPTIILILLVRKHFVRGLTMGAVD